MANTLHYIRENHQIILYFQYISVFEQALIIIGFAITGLGLSNLIPIVFSAAGNLPGVAPGISLSLTTTIGYSGVLIAPAALGYISEFTGFSILFSGLAIFLFAVFFLAPITRHADFGQNQSTNR